MQQLHIRRVTGKIINGVGGGDCGGSMNYHHRRCRTKSESDFIFRCFESTTVTLEGGWPEAGLVRKAL
jgi:hypothetical protein